MSKDMFMRSILPIGLLFSASLILSNTAYLYLSVAYIQMLKVCLGVAMIFLLLLTISRRRSPPSPFCSSLGHSVSKNRTVNSP